MRTVGWRLPRGWAAALVLGGVTVLASCSQDPSAGPGSGAPALVSTDPSTPTPSTTLAPWLQPASDLTDYSTRLGNNRVAAEAAIKVGRDLYVVRHQFWEVYVTTDPASLRPPYDPNDPASLERAARGVSRVDVLMATESGSAIKDFGAGGAEHERQQLTALAQRVGAIFPAATTVGIRVLFGENNPHSSATYRGGILDYHNPAS